ncbi:hypothetical protein ACLOJK_029030 [Asimina triloba]
MVGPKCGRTTNLDQGRGPTPLKQPSTRGKELENGRDVPSEVGSLPYESGFEHEILVVRGKRMTKPGVRKTVKRPKTKITPTLPKDPNQKLNRKTLQLRTGLNHQGKPSGGKPSKEPNVQEMVNPSRVGFSKAPKGEVVTEPCREPLVEITPKTNLVVVRAEEKVLEQYRDTPPKVVMTSGEPRRTYRREEPRRLLRRGLELHQFSCYYCVMGSHTTVYYRFIGKPIKENISVRSNRSDAIPEPQPKMRLRKAKATNEARLGKKGKGKGKAPMGAQANDLVLKQRLQAQQEQRINIQRGESVSKYVPKILRPNVGLTPGEQEGKRYHPLASERIDENMRYGRKIEEVVESEGEVNQEAQKEANMRDAYAFHQLKISSFSEVENAMFVENDTAKLDRHYLKRDRSPTKEHNEKKYDGQTSKG